MRGNAVIALDIDGTMTTADPDALQMLYDHAKNDQLSDLYINTARDEAYCMNPTHDTTQWVSKKNSFCRPTYGNVVDWKVKNMDRMIEREGVARECAVLIDDRSENITGVESQGYIGIKVDPRTGITKDTVREVFHRIEKCGVVWGSVG
jgi:hypothetical protein